MRALRGAVAPVALVIAAALCGGLAASAGATPMWLAPVNLSEAGFTGESPQVAVDGHGDVTAVWGLGGGGNYAVQAAVRPAGDTWQTPVTLSEAGVDAGGTQVAVDPEGTGIAVWDTFPVPPATAARTIQAAVRSESTGAWSAPVTLATIGEPTGNPQVAIDPHGNAVAVWEEQPVNPGPQYIQASFRPTGGMWSMPVDISLGNGGSKPHVVMDPEGNAVVTWSGYDSVQSVVRLASNGVWQQPVEVAAISLEAGGSPGGPALAVDGAGDVVTAWSSTIGSGSNHIVQAAILPAGGAWQTPADLSEAGLNAGSPDVALNPSGDTVVTWSAAASAVVGSKSAVVQAALRPAGSTWQAPVDISEPGQEVDEPPFEPKAVVDPQGNAIAVWEGLDGEDRVIQSAVRPAGSGDWQAPVNLSASDVRANNTQIAVDAQGNAVSVWRLENGSESIIQAAGYDAGPLIAGLEVPKTGTAGKPVSFSCSPLAVWSALGVTDWSFGDGTGASGVSTTHVYTTPGDYTVTLNSVDALGNASSASATIAISPAHTTPAIITTPPALTDVSLTNRRFRVGKRATAIAARKTPVGTSFRFTLSTLAKLQITISRSAPGLREGHLCRAPRAKLARAHAKRCTRTLPVGSLTRRSEPKGADSLPFSGRIGHRALNPGTYTAVLSATDAGGHSKPVALTFVIVR